MHLRHIHDGKVIPVSPALGRSKAASFVWTSNFLQAQKKADSEAAAKLKEAS